jgi:hypothetical protein
MEASELRIGNYLKHKNNFVFVDSIYENRFECRVEKRFIDYSKINCDEFQPIELTEDLKTKIFTLFNSEYRIEWKNNRVHIYFHERYLATCDYVHEYQNIHFALTNEELTMNL